MTALEPVLAELREQKECLGQYDPATVDVLIALVDPRTPAAPEVEPPTRPYRTTLPHAWPLCSEPKPGPGAALLCTNFEGHLGGHVAEGTTGRVFARWSRSGATP